MSDWEFIEGDEDKLSWWRLKLSDKDSERLDAEFLCVWPEIQSNGHLRFGYGITTEDYGYFEFEYHGIKPYLDQAKEAAENMITKC